MQSDSDGEQCYKEDCPVEALEECRATLCFRDYGCGKMMCPQHKTKKFIKKRDYGDYPRSQFVCENCEDEASRCSCRIRLMPLGWIILFVIIVVASVVLKE